MSKIFVFFVRVIFSQLFLFAIFCVSSAQSESQSARPSTSLKYLKDGSLEIAIRGWPEGKRATESRHHASYRYSTTWFGITDDMSGKQLYVGAHQIDVCFYPYSRISLKDDHCDGTLDYVIFKDKSGKPLRTFSLNTNLSDYVISRLNNNCQAKFLVDGDVSNPNLTSVSNVCKF